MISAQQYSFIILPKQKPADRGQKCATFLIHMHAGRRVRPEAQGSAVIAGVAGAPPRPGSTASTKTLIPIAKGLLCHWETPLHPSSCFLVPPSWGPHFSSKSFQMTIVPEAFSKMKWKWLVITRVKTQINAFHSVIEGYRNEELRIPPTKETCTRPRLLGIPLLDWEQQINLGDCWLPLSQTSLWQIAP